MSAYLLQVAVGPVQGFIAAARRTRDLWCGSLILSEVAKAAARNMSVSGALLIFPALGKGDRKLEPYSEDDQITEFNVANIILAEVPENIGWSPEHIAEEAKKAAQARWREIAEEARAKGWATAYTKDCGKARWGTSSNCMPHGAPSLREAITKVPGND